MTKTYIPVKRIIAGECPDCGEKRDVVRMVGETPTGETLHVYFCCCGIIFTERQTAENGVVGAGTIWQQSWVESFN